MFEAFRKEFGDYDREFLQTLIDALDLEETIQTEIEAMLIQQDSIDD